MDWKKIARALGLSDDATEDDLVAKLAERSRPPVGPGTGTTPTPPAPQATNSGIDTSNLSGDMKTFADTLNQQFAEVRKQLSEQARMNMLSNMVNQQFAEIQGLLQTSQEQTRTAQATALSEQLTNTNGKRYALPATIQDKLRSQLLSESPDKVDLKDVVAMFTELTEKGLVPLGEQTTGQPQAGQEQTPSNTDPQGEFLKFAEELQKANPKLSDVDAFEQAAVAHPDLYNKAYRNAAFIEGEVR
jgi:hypothetical protein